MSALIILCEREDIWQLNDTKKKNYMFFHAAGVRTELNLRSLTFQHHQPIISARKSVSWSG